MNNRKMIYDTTNTIAILSPNDDKWVNYLSSCSNANIFHHPAWLRLMEKCYGYEPSIIVVIDSHGTIKAGLPYMKVKSWLTGNRIVSLPFSDHCFPLYNEEADLLFLMDGLFEYVKQMGYEKVELRGDFPISSEQHCSSQFAFHSIPLQEDFNLIAANIHHMNKRNARIAERNGLHLEWGNSHEHLKLYYRLHLQERRDQGMPVQPWKYFSLLEKQIFSHDLGNILFAYQGDRVLAAVVLLYFGQTLTYKYGASLRSELKLRPNDFLFWNAIQWGCRQGYKIFDMGRTELDNSGLRSYKTRWGAEEFILTYKNFGSQPPGRSNKSINSLMECVIRNSPLWVCRTSGELLYRHFG